MAAAFPTLAEVQLFLSGQGFTLGATGQAVIDGVIASFERETGFQPFLATASDDYTFDPPWSEGGYRLSFLGGFAEITAIEIDGSAVTVTDDFVYEPTGYSENSSPIRAVRFLRHPGYLSQSVVITGRRGYGDEVPDDVWLAVRDKMAAVALPYCVTGSGTAMEVKQGSVDVKFDVSAGRSKVDRWEKNYRSMVRRIRTI